MPYPLAHPAAVLPFRRYCPRYLSFPALVIGSLTPDIGYCFANLHLDWFSHRFLAGAFGFCLPVGLVLVLVFYAIRSRVAGILPTRYRLVFLPLCRHPAGSPLAIAVSLLIGAWTHLFLDSLAHRDGWLVEHLPVLQVSVPLPGGHTLGVYGLLYDGCTFFGVAWLAVCYLQWLERATGSPAPATRGKKLAWAVLPASAILLIALASRGADQSIRVIPGGILALLVVIGFVLATWKSPSPAKKGSPAPNSGRMQK